MNAEELKVRHLHPFLHGRVWVLQVPALACTAPDVRPWAIRVGGPEEADVLAAVECSADVDAGDGEIVLAVFRAVDLLRDHGDQNESLTSARPASRVPEHLRLR